MNEKAKPLTKGEREKFWSEAYVKEFPLPTQVSARRFFSCLASLKCLLSFCLFFLRVRFNY